MERYTYAAPDQFWSDEVIKTIRKRDNVIYHKGVFGIRIIPRENSNPLLELLSEDDGFLQSSDRAGARIVDASWADDLISVLEDAKGYIKAHPNKFGVFKERS